MKGYWLFASGLSLSVACGVARDSTRSSSSGGPPLDAGPKASSGGAPLGTGGGISCTGDGRVPESLKLCGTDADCATLMIPGCCGGLIAGITRSKTCTPLVPPCTRALCPAVYSAEDGNNSAQGMIEVACQRLGDGGSGSCRTAVVTTPTGAAP